MGGWESNSRGISLPEVGDSLYSSRQMNWNSPEFEEWCAELTHPCGRRRIMAGGFDVQLLAYSSATTDQFEEVSCARVG